MYTFGGFGLVMISFYCISAVNTFREIQKTTWTCWAKAMLSGLECHCSRWWLPSSWVNPAFPCSCWTISWLQTPCLQLTNSLLSRGSWELLQSSLHLAWRTSRSLRVSALLMIQVDSNYITFSTFEFRGHLWRCYPFLPTICWDNLSPLLSFLEDSFHYEQSWLWGDF